MFSIKAAVADVEKSVKSVVGWLVKEYSVFYKSEPSIEKVVDDTVSYVEIGLPIVLTATGEGALAPEVNDVLNEVVSDLHVVAATVYDFGPSPSAASVLASVQSNLAGLETAGHIKDPAKLAKLKLLINAVGSLAQIIVKAVAAAKADSAPSAPAEQKDPA